jgi:hypothetical protein
MSPRAVLLLWFAGVLAAMSWVTVWASLDQNVLAGGAALWALPWGRATLFDAYFAFVAVWLWIAWRERSAAVRLAWLLAILLFGNFAIAGYFLLALRSAPRSAPLDALFGRRGESAP